MIRYLNQGITKFIMLLSLVFSNTLQEAYNNAGPMNGYQKYIILNQNTTYLGGVGIFEESTYIDGNGAVINLDNGLGIWAYCDSTSNIILDISRCTIINGSEYGISFSGFASGQVINCNIINSNYGLKLFDNSDVIIKNCNLINNETYGIGIFSTSPNLLISYSNAWGNGENYMENCPG